MTYVSAVVEHVARSGPALHLQELLSFIIGTAAKAESKLTPVPLRGSSLQASKDVPLVSPKRSPHNGVVAQVYVALLLLGGEGQ